MVHTNRAASRIATPGPQLHPRRRPERVGRTTAGRLFLLMEKAVRQLTPSVHPIWSGLWLGVLPTRVMEAIDKAYYDASVMYHGSRHNLQGLFPWEVEAVLTYFSRRPPLMVLGAGGGREVIALRRLGFEADGWECNPTLVAAAREILRVAGCSGAVHPMPRSRVPEGSGPYDGVILGWATYMLVPGRERRVELLRGARARLPLGAPLLLSVHGRPEGCRRSARVMRTAQALRRLLRRDPPEMGDDMAPNYLHRFTREEVRQELEDGGFRLVRWQRSDPRPYSLAWAVGEAS